MFCQKCGNRSIEGASFCQKCGSRLPVEDTDPQREKPAVGDEAVYFQPEASAIDAVETAGQLDVTLTDAGTDKVNIIKKVRELTGLGLKDAKELVENTPVILKKGITQTEAKAVKERFLKTGAAVIFTNQEGSCVNIILHCKACGAALEDGSDICKSCGRVFTSQPNHDTTTVGVSTTDSVSFNVWAELFQEFKKMPAVRKVITVLGALLVVSLVILVLRLILSSLVVMIVVIAGGYFVYYRWGAIYITEYKYRKRIRDLHLPDGISPQTLLEALSGKFNYPYFKGVRYGKNGECVIDGRYSAYTITIEDNGAVYLSADLNVEDKRTVMLEGIAICGYINKFFNPSSAVDVVKDVKALKSAERQRKTIGLVITVASVLVVAVFALEYAMPGSLQRIAIPGAEVRSAYLTQYSETVTVEEAFENFFDKPKWSTYEADGYSYVAFTGSCEFLGERADVRITFKITGEQFLVENLDVNGRTQNDIMLYSLLSAVYEND